MRVMDVSTKAELYYKKYDRLALGGKRGKR